VNRLRLARGRSLKMHTAVISSTVTSTDSLSPKYRAINNSPRYFDIQNTAYQLRRDLPARATHLAKLSADWAEVSSKAQVSTVSADDLTDSHCERNDADALVVFSAWIHTDRSCSAHVLRRSVTHKRVQSLGTVCALNRLNGFPFVVLLYYIMFQTRATVIRTFG
jgi:hypothetical protein